MAKDKPQPVALADLITSTAQEIRDAHARAPKDGGVMQFTGCEIELAVKATVEGGGGIKFWVIDISGKAGAETASKIKLTFGPTGVPKVFAAIAPGSAVPMPYPEEKK